MKGIFITGTDTNVGKTYIACKIAAALKKQNINVIPRKPVESGCQLIDGNLIPDDALKLQQASQSNESLDTICPYRFQQAISPARAARLNNQKISIEQLTQSCTIKTNKNSFLLIEGAGGFYSPICEDGLNADLAASLNLPVVLVCEDRVGSINQVLLSLNAIQRTHLNVKAILLNQINKPHSTDNLHELSDLTTVPVFVVNTKTSFKTLADLLLDI